ncbi:uncharacterized protein F4807DRAFT_431913 [Annulohypoxylon truncatum]|uniref:uncharacterized protein n=1 Tax=Annulohypoxylon truncatum TaxID=327061 RepID=UPI0020083EB1|nr:uncharacterized protein F4807DRAFT_431913 [Annulohypoxylon truncatum]KAI1208185.1 hypothetical protein F4807DRAFT_431913 [Annulohypoxylon truncatum]
MPSPGYQVAADPDVLEALTTTHTPWPGYEGNLDLLRRQGAVEKTMFQDNATIDFDKIPSVQFWAPLVGYNKKHHVRYVVVSVMEVAEAARRPLTPQEIDITSEFAALSSRWYPLCNLSAVATAGSLSTFGARDFRFPFYTPSPKTFDPYVFPKKTYPLLKGAKATFAWHTLRCSLYFAASYAAFIPLASSLAAGSFEARIRRDPRLEDLRGSIREHMLQVRAMITKSLQGPGMGFPQRPQERPSHQIPRAQDVPKSENQARLDHGRDTYNEQTDNGFNEPATDPSKGMTPTPQPSWSQNPRSPVPPNNTQDTKFPDPGSRYVDDSDPFDDDDGSPVPASVRRAEAQRSRSIQGGSTWDRIRQQSQSTNSSGRQGAWSHLRQDKAPNPRETQPNKEGFAYTKQDEDKETRNYEREQAQKEFDALLEAERHGRSNRR